MPESIAQPERPVESIDASAPQIATKRVAPTKLPLRAMDAGTVEKDARRRLVEALRLLEASDPEVARRRKADAAEAIASGDEAKLNALAEAIERELSSR
jgi:hypothetical protein